MNFIQSVILFTFIISGLVVTSLPLFIEDSPMDRMNENSLASDPVVNESFFRDINYYTLKGGKENLQLKATDLTTNRSTSKTIFFSPDGVAITASGVKIKYKADRGEFVANNKFLKLDGKVELLSDSSFVKANNVKFYGKEDLIDCKGDILSRSHSELNGDTIEVSSDEVKIYTQRNRSIFKGNVVGEVKRKKVYEENIQFQSLYMKLHMDENKAYLENDVLLEKRGIKAYSRSGEIFLENYNKRLKYFVLYDDVRVVEKVKPSSQNGIKKSFERKAFSEKLEGIMSERKIILSGYPKVIQRGDVIKGNLIVLRQDIDVIEVVDANTNFNIGK